MIVVNKEKINIEYGFKNVLPLWAFGLNY